MKVRGTLRAATDAVHQRLHLAPPFVAIAEQRLSMSAYRSLLGRLALFHFTVGASLDLAGDRRALLARDLERVGAAQPAEESWNAPLSAAARLGCTYVVEGSALGGKVIYRQLDYLFGEQVEGRRFFRGSPEDGKRWRLLCQQLETQGRETGAVEQMVAGARSTFGLFEQLLAAEHAHG